MQLYNKLSAKERAALIDEAGEDRITISFYQYHHIKNPQIFRDKLFLEWNELDVLGRTYVSMVKEPLATFKISPLPIALPVEKAP